MRRWRTLILVLAMPVYLWVLISVGWLAAGLLMGASPREFIDSVIDPEFWSEWVISASGWNTLIVPAILLVLTQFLFIVPAFSLRLQRGNRGGHPLLLTVIGAGLTGAVLTAGGILMLCDVWVVLGRSRALPVSSPFGGGVDPLWGSWGESTQGLAFWCMLGLSWVFWTFVLFSLTRRGDPRRWHRRLAVGLLAGTILEVLVTVPIDVMVRRRTSCYCETGTFLTLCCSVWALLWLAGPGIVLALTSRRRRFYGDTHCLNCGYAKGPTPADRCPECGYDWIDAA